MKKSGCPDTESRNYSALIEELRLVRSLGGVLGHQVLVEGISLLDKRLSQILKEKPMKVIHSTVVNVLQRGGGVSVSAGDYTFDVLEQFAQHARHSGARLIIRDAGTLVHTTLIRLSQLGGNTVVLEL